MICNTQSEKTVQFTLSFFNESFWVIQNISSTSKNCLFWSGIYEGIWNDYLDSVSTALYLSAHHSSPSRRSCCWLQKDENCKLHSSKTLQDESFALRKRSWDARWLLEVFQGGGARCYTRWMDGWRKHEGAFFLRKSQLSLQTAPQLDPRWTRSGTTSSLIFR